MTKLKKPAKYLNTIGTLKSLRKVDDIIGKNPRKSINVIANELKFSRYSIGRLANEDLRYKTYVRPGRQVMFAKTKDNRQIQAKRLLSKMRHQEPGIIVFFLKNLNQKVNQMTVGYVAALRTF